jgi:hypothetical protein
MLVAGSIVIPGNKAVNSNALKADTPVILALDGAPLPPPPRENLTMLLADGAPLPPPPRLDQNTLMADGTPWPRPPRENQAAAELV